MDENYYISHGGKIPVKWTAPEVHYARLFKHTFYIICLSCHLDKLDCALYIANDLSPPLW